MMVDIVSQRVQERITQIPWWVPVFANFENGLLDLEEGNGWGANFHFAMAALDVDMMRQGGMLLAEGRGRGKALRSVAQRPKTAVVSTVPAAAEAPLLSTVPRPTAAPAPGDMGAAGNGVPLGQPVVGPGASTAVSTAGVVAPARLGGSNALEGLRNARNFTPAVMTQESADTCGLHCAGQILDEIAPRAATTLELGGGSHVSTLLA